MASSLRLTTSDKSEIFQKHEAISRGAILDVNTYVNFEYLFLKRLDICCDVNQLFGGQGDWPPTLTATFIH